MKHCTGIKGTMLMWVELKDQINRHKIFITFTTGSCIKRLFIATLLVCCNKLESLPLPFTSPLVYNSKASLGPTIRVEYKILFTLVIVSIF